MPRLTIDGREVTVAPGATVLDAARQVGIEIPSLCFLDGCETLLLESNHDPDMLAGGPYPTTLKRRVAGALGHLSNGQAGDLLAKLPHAPSEVVLMHLSETNNTPDLARLSAEAALGHGGTRLRIARQRQVTELGAANFAPFFTPDGEGVIFVSNHHNPGGRNFDIFLIRLDGTGLEQVTFNETFDGFPMFSPDGTKLAFCSNRGNARPGETNVFVAQWVP